MTTQQDVPVRDSGDGARFLVRVAPRARRTAILGIHGEGTDAALKVALQAPPLEGRANAALIEFLAEVLELPRSAIRIGAGEHGRNKAIVVHGRNAAHVAEKIRTALAGRT
ncbi:MAG TPA: DUF167 domain-containing protein [Acidobacteriaceae bacterium]|nr:DUF167 domain-containing protein [Acidobacteriaceae bacterium]